MSIDFHGNNFHALQGNSEICKFDNPQNICTAWYIAPARCDHIGLFLTLTRPYLNMDNREILLDHEETDTTSQSTDRILEHLNHMERNLGKDIRDVSKRVDLLERRDKS